VNTGNKKEYPVFQKEYWAKDPVRSV